MFAQAHTPEYLSPDDLDLYLEQGWFRMGQTIFTTNFLHFKDQLYSAIWLRIILNDLSSDSTQIKLFKRNAVFRTTIKPAELTEDKEELYIKYKQSLPFQPSESLSHLLFGRNDSHDTIYNTYEITVHDGDRLIACGFFDIGETSAAGISSFYDPEYKKYSLGKYLIYAKIEHCKNLKLRYFYPGYFVPGYSFFDYKLTIGKSALEFLHLASHQWFYIELFSSEHIPLKTMFDKMAIVQKRLVELKLETSVVKYEYFDSNLIPALRDAGLFDFPVFLYCPGESGDGMNPILVFDVRDACYHLLKCFPIWKPDQLNEDLSFYSAYFIKSMLQIHTTPHVEEIAEVFLRSLKV